MHKIINKNAPTNLINRFTKKAEKNYHNELNVEHPRIDLFMESLHYSGGSLWNNLPSQMRQIRHLYSFKTAYKKLLFTEI